MTRSRRVVVVTGLSGAGKSSVLRTLEDAGYDAVDNPPLSLVVELVRRGGPRLAIGIDARTSGFDAGAVLATLAALRSEPGLKCELVYAKADEAILLRRYTETRRRHPLSPRGRVVDGIAAERDATAPLLEAADLVLDTSDMPLAALRLMVEQQFAPRGSDGLENGLTVSLISFAYPAGLPREADLVFDARFLRNPHYDSLLRPLTGMSPEVGAYVEADPDCAAFFRAITGLLALVLPRFVQEGKKYATVAIGCTGGQHRSVYLVEKLGAHLVASEGGKWRVTVTHRELARREHPWPGELARTYTIPVQAQEA
jgi:UPF0042 nucleotide-binding protein